MFTSYPLLAEGSTRIFLDWGRLESNADLVLPLLVVVALDILARYIIHLDTRELPRLVGWVLTALRAGTILCLLVIYLQPQWRSQREVVRNSRVLLLVDTSSSMGLTDVDLPSVGDQDAPPNGRLAPGGSNRVDEVAAALDETHFLNDLRQTHDVIVLRFDEDVHRLVSLPKLAVGPTTDGSGPDAPDTPGRTGRSTLENPGGPAGDPSETIPESTAHNKIDWSTALTPTGTQTRLGQALTETIHGQRGSPVSGIVVFSDGGQNAGISPEAAVEMAKAVKVPIFTVGVGSERRAVDVRLYKLEVPPQAYPGDPYSVTGLIQAQGLAGESVTAELLVRDAEEGAYSPEPGSGVLAHRQEVVLGGDGEAVPVKFELTPTATGRRTICLRVRAPATDSDPGNDYLEEEIAIVDRKTRVLLFAGGPTREYRFLRNQLYRDASTTVDILLQTSQSGISQEAHRILDDFPVTPEEMYAYDCLVAFDPNWQMLIAAQVDLLERWVGEQAGGLIVIPGPVYAGESVGGWVQDPALAKIRALYPVEFQRRLTVFDSGTYVSSEPWPLDFTREGLEAEFLWLDDTATASRRAWAGFAGVYSYFPVRGPKPGATVLAHFSDPRAGLATGGGWASPAEWPGGTSRVPHRWVGDRQPVYFAEQFYGSGRVFYLASGEMWRLRRLDDAHFERFYTSLIRHVSQGRLLRQSSRGALMVGKDRYVLGSTVEIRARLTNAQFGPLEAPGVSLDVIKPDGNIEAVTLRPEPSPPIGEASNVSHRWGGVFTGRLTVFSEGTYRLELAVPESDDERLTRYIKVSLPDLERQNPQRNDKLLSRIAQATGGKYYQRLEAALNAEGPDPLVARLKDRTKTIIQTGALQPPTLRWLLEERLPGRPSQQTWFSWLADESWLRKLFDQTLLWWLMIILCSLLCCEWLIRRLSKLA